MQGLLSYLGYSLNIKRYTLSPVLEGLTQREEMIDKISSSFHLSPDKVRSHFDRFDDDSRLEFEVEFNNQKVIAKDIISQIQHRDAVYPPDSLYGYVILHALEKERGLRVRPFFSVENNRLVMYINIFRFR